MKELGTISSSVGALIPNPTFQTFDNWFAVPSKAPLHSRRWRLPSAQKVDGFVMKGGHDFVEYLDFNPKSDLMDF